MNEKLISNKKGRIIHRLCLTYMDKIIEKLWLAVRSKTVWTFVVLFIVSGIDGVRDMIPLGVLHVIQPVLTVLGIYFRVTPKAE